MSAFTPGPWRVLQEPFCVVAVNHPHTLICEITGSRDNPTAQADARLIAAAPELADACKLALEFWYSDHPNDTVEGIAAHRRIAAALASAVEP